MTTIYVERAGGAWQAFYYTEGGGQRWFRDEDHVDAVRRAAWHYGLKKGDRFKLVNSTLGTAKEIRL